MERLPFYWDERRSIVNNFKKAYNVPRDVFKPIIYLFLLSGIDIRGSFGRPIVLFMSLVFHAACFGIMGFKTACLFRAFRWNMLVTISMKNTTLILWWMVFARRKRIRRFIDSLGKGGGGNFSKTISLITVVFMVVQPCLLSRRFFDAPKKGHSCKLLNPHEGGPLQAFLVMLHEFVCVYVNFSIPCAVAILYVTSCKVLSSAISNPPFPLLKVFNKVLQVFQTIEELLSPCILVIFAHVLCTTFKNIVILIHVFQNSQFTMAPAYLLDFVANSSMTAGIILFSDAVKGRASTLRDTLLVTESKELSCKGYMKLVDDRHRLRLTAWGMFNLRKSLLLTLGTTFVTYGVILLQFTDKD